MARVMPNGVVLEKMGAHFKIAGRLEFLEMLRREKGWGAFDYETDQKRLRESRAIFVAVCVLCVGFRSFTRLRPGFLKMLLPRNW